MHIIQFSKKGLVHTSDFMTLKRHNFILCNTLPPQIKEKPEPMHHTQHSLNNHCLKNLVIGNGGSMFHTHFHGGCTISIIKIIIILSIPHYYILHSFTSFDVVW